MASALRIDTLKFAKRLTEAGLPPAAAEAIVEGLNDSDLSELATKAELQSEIGALRAEMKTEFAAVRTEIAAVRGELRGEIGSLRGEIGSLRADLYGRLWAMGLGIVGLTVALIKLLPG
jgi:hypothetical protein